MGKGKGEWFADNKTVHHVTSIRESCEKVSIHETRARFSIKEREKRRRIIHVKSFLRKNPVINSEPSNGTLYNVQIKFYFAIKV